MPLALLPAATRKLLSSCQVITSVTSVVKELVENAIDAGACSIEVKLENNGINRIEVKDDGCGISSSDVLRVCLPHYTSKIAAFSDLEQLDSYGFRGEALHSLCAVADVTMTTRTDDDDHATTFTFSKDGTVVSSKPSHLARGTQVVATNLFRNLPVRRQFASSSRRANLELKRVESMVKCLAVINPRLRFSFSHNKCMLWQKPGVATVREAVILLFGHATASRLEHLSVSHHQVSASLLVPRRHCKDMVSLCHPSPDCIMVFLNRRPVRYKRIEKMVVRLAAEHFSGQYVAGRYPMCMVSLEVPGHFLDVNLEPNKTRVLCHNEGDILSVVENLIQSYYEPSRHSDADALPAPDTQGKFMEEPRPEGAIDTIADTSPLKIPSAMTASTPLAEHKQDSPMGVSHLASPDLEGLTEQGTRSNIVDNEPAQQREVTDPDEGVGNRENAPVNCQFISCDANISDDSGRQEMNNRYMVESGNNTGTKIPENTIESLWDAADKAMGFWSRGHVKSTDGDLIEGASLLVADAQPHVPGDDRRSPTQQVMAPHPTKKRKVEGRQVSSVSSALTVDASGVLHTSIMSASSQMGCQEQGAFTRFSKEMRPKILVENPGLAFTKLAILLVDEWRKLGEEERARYEVIAKEEKKKKVEGATPNCRKITDMLEGVLCPPKKVFTREGEMVNVTVEELRKRRREGRCSPMSQAFTLIGQLKPCGSWVYRRGRDLGIIRHWGLQEVVMYKKLLREHTVPVVPLDTPQPVHEGTLGPTLWKKLSAMMATMTASKAIVISDPLLVKNGFCIELRQGRPVLTQVAATIRFYGLDELRELLRLTDISDELARCRPFKVVNYIKSEAVRLTRQGPSTVGEEELTQLLSVADTHMTTCLHNKAIFEVIHTL